MHAKLKYVTLMAVFAATTVSLQGLPSASAAEDSFRHIAYAGGTRITAVGTTVSSDLTAESAVNGKKAATASNKVASVKVSGLVQVGAVTTDVKSEEEGIGFKATSHARTANISLLNGAIKVSAIDTTSVAESNGTDAPTTSTTTELLGLTIAGKKYPVNVPANTGITIPGVAQVVLNASYTSTSGKTAVAQNAGLYVTLLKARSGVAAGAEIMLNPTFTAVAQVTDKTGGYQLGGGGYGAYAFAHVGDEIKAETGKLGIRVLPPLGTDGKTLTNTTAKVSVSGLLSAKAIESSATGVTTPALSEATGTSEVLNLQLFPKGLGSLISAKAIGSSSHVRLDGEGDPVTEGSLQFIELKIAGKAIPIDVAPNTTIDVAGLGKVVINEQKEIRVPGVGHGYQVNGLHITLDTAKAGLPVGAEIQLATSQAVVYH